MPSAHRPPSPPELIDRFEAVLERFPELQRRKMFGYPAAFVAAGHMVSGLHGARWIVRLGEAAGAELRSRGGTVFEPMPGRPMAGFFSLPNEVMDDDLAISDWIEQAQAYATGLPPKKPR